MKKVNENSPALCSNSLALRRVFGGPTARSPRPYDCNAQIICIWHLDNESENSKIL